jgi:hypothetical protein
MTAAANFLSFDDIASLGDAAYLERLRTVVPVPSAEKIAELDIEIKAFEVKYGFDSTEMRARLNSRALEETSDVCDWLIALDLRTRLGSSTAR